MHINEILTYKMENAFLLSNVSLTYKMVKVLMALFTSHKDVTNRKLRMRTPDIQLRLITLLRFHRFNYKTTPIHAAIADHEDAPFLPGTSQFLMYVFIL